MLASSERKLAATEQTSKKRLDQVHELQQAAQTLERQQLEQGSLRQDLERQLGELNMTVGKLQAANAALREDVRLSRELAEKRSSELDMARDESKALFDKTVEQNNANAELRSQLDQLQGQTMSSQVCKEKNKEYEMLFLIKTNNIFSRKLY